MMLRSLGQAWSDNRRPFLASLQQKSKSDDGTITWTIGISVAMSKDLK